MNPRKIQEMIESARATYVPGIPIDAETDQMILIGICDGLGGCASGQEGTKAIRDGIEIGRAIRAMAGKHTP